MIKLISIIALAATLSSPALANEIHERTYSANGHNYVITFLVHENGLVIVPATYPAGQPHFPADISVSEIIAGKRQQLGKDFKGLWTPNGCFEDNPKVLVEAALDLLKA